MVDMWNKQKRSDMMSRIRSHGNKSTELRLIAIFKAYGITGWRRKRKLPGSPDFVFAREHVAVFVDGCFWHGCPKCYRKPTTNQDFWAKKYLGNKRRDERVDEELHALEWRVLRVWEHQLGRPGIVSATIKRVLRSRPTTKNKLGSAS